MKTDKIKIRLGTENDKQKLLNSNQVSWNMMIME